MLRTVIILSCFLPLLNAVNNFGLNLELGAITPDNPKPKGKPIRERITNFVRKPEINVSTASSSRIQNKTVDLNREQEYIGGEPFFAKFLNRTSSSGEKFDSVRSRAIKVLQAFEKLMIISYGDFCDPTTVEAEAITKYFGNLNEVSIKDLVNILNQTENIISMAKPLCNSRDFLKCDEDTGTCNYIADGVVDTLQSETKTIYKLGGGTACFTFPKIFDSIAEAQCAENTQGYCDRMNPGICTCTV